MTDKLSPELPVFGALFDVVVGLQGDKQTLANVMTEVGKAWAAGLGLTDETEALVLAAIERLSPAYPRGDVPSISIERITGLTARQVSRASHALRLADLIAPHRASKSAKPVQQRTDLPDPEETESHRAGIRLFPGACFQQTRSVASGLHPTGLPFDIHATSRCGLCRFVASRSGRYICTIAPYTAEATETRIVRSKWRGCAAYKEARSEV